MGKAKAAAIKIFSYIDNKNKINAVDIEESALQIDQDTFMA